MTITITELRQRLRSENVPEDCYSLEGGLPDERYCLGTSESGWEVYYSERGRKSNLKQFTSEHEACEYFYQRLKGMLRYG